MILKDEKNNYFITCDSVPGINLNCEEVFVDKEYKFPGAIAMTARKKGWYIADCCICPECAKHRKIEEGDQK